MNRIIIKNHLKHLCRLLALMLTLFLIVSVIQAPVNATGSKENVVRVGYYENEVFQEGAAKNAVKKGYAYEYYLKLSEYTGWKYEYVYGSYGDLYQMLLDGKIDLLAGLARKKDREALIGYPDIAMGNETYSLVKHYADNDITTNPSSLSGKTIGVLDSAMKDVLERYLSEHKVSATVKPYQDYETLFDDFDSRKVDILAAEGDGAYGRKHAEVLFPFGESDYFLCVSKKRKDILAELNTAQAMLAVEEPNYLHSLKTKYYPVSFSARAFSTAEKEWLHGHDRLRVGYLENYLPYSDTDKQGNATGIVKDLTSKMIKELGIDDLDITYKGYANYDEMIKAMSSEKIDVAFPVGGGLFFSEENGIYQSTPIASTSTELIFKGKYTEDTVKSFAVNKNNRMQYYYVKTNFPDAKISFYPTIQDCLDAVLDGKAKCTTLNGLRANDMLKNSKYKSLSLTQLSRNDDRCYGVEIGNEGLLKILNRGINVVGNDYAQNIAFRYTGGLYSYTVVDFIRDHIVAFVLILICIAALIIGMLFRRIRRTRKEVRDKEKARITLEEKNRELAENKVALSEALAAEENANHAKTAFLNNMSHDMRTPMNAIVGFTNLAETHIDDKEKVKDYLDKISVSSHQLLALINDVLDMSRIESGNLKLEESTVNLTGLIKELETIVQSDIYTGKLTLEIDTSAVEHETVVTDELRLNQVLLNILSNAIKFTPEGGKISLTVSEKPSETSDTANYEFVITDTGIGMSEEFQKTIFEEFTRERTSSVSGIQGTGLGMAIAKNIIEAMGGSIAVNSTEGKGSKFTVDIPFKTVLETDDEEPDKQQEPKSENYDFTGKRVLLAEDNEMNQMIATEILENVGFLIDIAANGQEAVDKVRTGADGYYDIILMDIQMPVMDGYEATKQIRDLDDPAKAGIPILAVTANAFEEDRKNSLDIGMNGHLSKPYDIPEMMKTLHSLLKVK